MNTKIYVEIGLRSTPQSVLDALTKVATKLRKEGWVLRSGAAREADSAFEAGADAAHGGKEIYLIEV
jgi:predicted Rossmann fold nucleotide-binding protein DprA/Smf involved in DNA uptake